MVLGQVLSSIIYVKKKKTLSQKKKKNSDCPQKCCFFFEFQSQLYPDIFNFYWIYHSSNGAHNNRKIYFINNQQASCVKLHIMLHFYFSLTLYLWPNIILISSEWTATRNWNRNTNRLWNFGCCLHRMICTGKWILWNLVGNGMYLFFLFNLLFWITLLFLQRLCICVPCRLRCGWSYKYIVGFWMSFLRVCILWVGIGDCKFFILLSRNL